MVLSVRNAEVEGSIPFRSTDLRHAEKRTHAKPHATKGISVPRHPKPKRWASRKNAWFAQVNGKQRQLAPASATFADARKALHLILSGREPEPGEVARVALVGEVVASYIEHLAARAIAGDLQGQSPADAARRLRPLTDALGDEPAKEITPAAVERAYLASGWGATTRGDGITTAKAALGWAAGQGMIGRNPIEGKLLKRPRARRRDVSLGSDRAADVLDADLTPAFRELLFALRETGCRPKEARAVRACDVDFEAGVWVFAPHRSKTGERTGKARVVYLTPLVIELCRRLVAAHPEGPIFRNSRGRPWRKDAVVLNLRRVRQRMERDAAARGEPKPDTRAVIAYALRHGWATDALRGGMSIAVAAELMGHSNTRMLAERYSHLSEHSGILRRAAERVRPGDGES